MRPQVGQVINNKYRLIRLIGDGGMGSVYEAHHEVLGTKFALKFLHPELSRRSGLVQRFLQEARVSAHIQSPHVVRVSDVDQSANGLAFIVMEYIEGKTLQSLYEELYRAGQRLSYVDGLEYTMQMLDGVEAAHSAGIIHRDLKPDNVIITKGMKGEMLLKLLDFGIAKLKVTGELDKGLTRPGVIMGTPEYMAPEQAYSADKVDSRADIFSLGVMIFEMLAGRRPVGGDDPHQIAAQYLSGQVSKLTDLAPGVDASLAEAVHRAMAPMPKDRFSTVADFRAAIEPAAIAAKVPSVMAASLTRTPTPAPAAVTPGGESGGSAAAVTPAAPPTNAPAEDGYRAVPKTLPPEGDDEPAPGTAATPLGGFAHDQTVRATPIPAHALAAVAAAQAAAAADPGMQQVMPRTVSSPGFGVNGLPATASYDGGYGSAAARPGGTDIGGGGAFNGPGNNHAAAFPGTAPMDPLYSAPPPIRGTRAGKGPSLFLILMLAAGVSAAVVGGVYVAHEYAKVEDAKSDPVKSKVPTTPTAPPVITSEPPVATVPTVVTVPTIPPTVPPVRPTSKPTTTTTTPQPSTTTSRPTFTIPSTFPTIVIPSTFPTGIPTFPSGPSTAPPTQPPPGGTPTTTSTTPRRPPIRVPRGQ